jgi:hypothetical protein
MKHLFLFLATIALCISSHAVDEKTIDAKDAAQHVGETMVVTGTIADVQLMEDGGITLEFGNPNQVFVVFIPRT